MILTQSFHHHLIVTDLHRGTFGTHKVSYLASQQRDFFCAHKLEIELLTTCLRGSNLLH